MNLKFEIGLARANALADELLGVGHHLARGILEGYLTYKETHPPRTLPYDYAWGPMGVLGGWAVSYERSTPTDERLSVGHHSPAASLPCAPMRERERKRKPERERERERR